MIVYFSIWTHAHIYSWKLSPGIVLLAKACPWNKLSFFIENTGQFPKANGREPKTCLGQVFKYKLGGVDDDPELSYVDARPHL